ncbi:MAG: hypothetical protein ACR2M7_04280 [Bdellovibrionales bacterium]
MPALIAAKLIGKALKGKKKKAVSANKVAEPPKLSYKKEKKNGEGFKGAYGGK